MKSSFKISSLIIIALVFSSKVFSQNPVTLYIGNVDNICHDTFSIPVYVTKFRNIEDFGFSVDWDTTMFTIVAGTGGYTFPPATTAIGLNAASINSSRKGFGVAYYDANLLGQSLPDSSILFTLHFTIKNGYSSSNPSFIDSIYFGNNPVKISTVDTTDGNYGAPGTISSIFKNGYVSSAVVPVITYSGTVLTASTNNATAAPVSYQWYTVAGTPPVYTPIPGATSATYTYNGAKLTYAVVVTYASGAVDTSVIALPIKLLNFKGMNMKSANVLSWATATELNAAEFILERSDNNGETFRTIGSIKAAGNSAIEQAYSYQDVNLVLSTYLYRLKMVDDNGSYNYSKVVRLSNEGKKIFQILPNPIENSTIKIYGSNMKSAKVIDINGKEVLFRELSNSENAVLKLTNQPKGIYIIQVTTTDGFVQSEKCIVR